MAVALVGEVANSCDATTGFSAGNISGDDDRVEGTGALGAKVSNTYTAFYTTSLGAGAPYDFSVGGTEEGYHIIMYFGAKSPLNATSGQRIIAGNGTSRGEWDVPLSSAAEPKVSIFVSRVIDPTLDFDRIAAGSWTTTGNPAQLTSVSELGGGLQTTVSIMGSFNNAQIDQITVGLGVRMDGGSVGTPNTFETARAADEGSAKWGWWSSVLGTIVAKGKLFVGPATGSATSVMTDSDFVVLFAAERVASDFYEIDIRGAGTDVSWTRGIIAAEDPSVARWNLTLDSTVLDFDDAQGVWKGAGTITLDDSATLTDTTLIDCQSVVQSGSTITGCSFLDSPTAAGESQITSNDPGLISGCTFVSGGTGHAIEATTAGTYSLDGNTFTGYGTAGSTSAAFYNNSGGAITLNILGGVTAPTVRNGTSASTAVVVSNTLTLTGLKNPSEVRVFDNASPTTEIGGQETVTSGTYSLAIDAVTYPDVIIHVLSLGYQNVRLTAVEMDAGDVTIPILQSIDRQYENTA